MQLKFLLMKVVLLFFCSLYCCFSFSNNNDEEKHHLFARKAKSAIVIDGKLDEADWQLAEKAENFFQHYPYDTSFSKTKTEVHITYDDNFFYVGAVCYDTFASRNYIIQSLKRDFVPPANDHFGIFIDPFNDKTNGFAFTVNPVGVQMEALLSGGGGEFGVSSEWDNRWFAKVTNYPDKWVAEIAIPFKTLRFKEGTNNWRVNFVRNDLKNNEASTWIPVPKNFPPPSLAFTGNLNFEEPLKKTGGNFSIIPYISGALNRDYKDTTQTEAATGGNIGLDAKIAITSSLNLDVTINPDFSQVEVDKQQTNLTRFELSFPEKRQFFLENSDLFSQYGFMQIRPFFSRRIGIYKGQQVPIIGGMRLSGKLNENWRIGLLDIQTDKKSELGLASQNYGVASVQRKIFRSSYLGLIFVNRQAFDDAETVKNDFNRILGGDFNFATNNNKLRGKIFYHQSFTPIKMNEQFAHAVWLLYSSNKIFAMWNHEYVGKNYLAEVGFVPRIYNYDTLGNEIRLSYWRFEPMFEYYFYPKSSMINKHGPTLYASIYLDSAFKETEHLYKVGYQFKFQNTGSFKIEGHKHFTDLMFATDVTDMGNMPLHEGHYHYYMLKMEYSSDQRKRLNARIATRVGSFFNGNFVASDGEINFRTQPWGVFAASYSIDEIHLPEPNNNATIILVGPKLEFSFSKNMFFTTFVQYNTQVDNININSRFQWRFRPMSDLYIVYTDNYDVVFGRKNRALVMKLVYWLSV